MLTMQISNKAYHFPVIVWKR